jgi:6-pyruvoyltetrahydropterin/6-carboxytetrahydropterin synthase
MDITNEPNSKHRVRLLAQYICDGWHTIAEFAERINNELHIYDAEKRCSTEETVKTYVTDWRHCPGPILVRDNADGTRSYHVEKPTMSFQITKHIEIDAAHRIPDHRSKCRNIHGHRYRIEVACVGDANTVKGPTEGMAGGLDFGFLKDELVQQIDVPCDHGMILSAADMLFHQFCDYEQRCLVLDIMKTQGASTTISPLAGKLYVVPFVPTAEELARHWYDRLAPRIALRSADQARLLRVTVHETPTATARYPA